MDVGLGFFLVLEALVDLVRELLQAFLLDLLELEPLQRLASDLDVLVALGDGGLEALALGLELDARRELLEEVGQLLLLPGEEELL